MRPGLAQPESVKLKEFVCKFMLFELAPTYSETINVRPLGRGLAGIGPPTLLSAGNVEANLNKREESLLRFIFD